MIDQKVKAFFDEFNPRLEEARVHNLAQFLITGDADMPDVVVARLWDEIAPKHLPDFQGKYPKLIGMVGKLMLAEFPDGSKHQTTNCKALIELWLDFIERQKPATKKRVRGFEPVKDAPADTKLPTRGTSKSAGYDFYAPEDIVVPPRGYSKIVFLNVKAYMPDDEFLGLAIRSSMATTLESVFDDKGKVVKPESHLITAQGLCVIDSDYYSNADNDGNIGVMFYNFGDKPRMIKKGERCCQGIFMKYGVADNDVSQGVREGGYGSTGK